MAGPEKSVLGGTLRAVLLEGALVYCLSSQNCTLTCGVLLMQKTLDPFLTFLKSLVPKGNVQVKVDSV